jgi:hypothetical protein
MWVLVGIDISTHPSISIETLYALNEIAHLDFDVMHLNLFIAQPCIWP